VTKSLDPWQSLKLNLHAVGSCAILLSHRLATCEPLHSLKTIICDFVDLGSSLLIWLNMVVPIQLGDVQKALELILWIREHCFSKFNAADRRYAELRDDIIFFEQVLKQLQNAVEQAALQLQSTSDFTTSRFSDFQQESQLLVGNFRTTLEECRTILEKHSHLNGRSATFLENGLFNFDTEPKIKALRSRLQFHSQKILLIIEPIKLGLIIGIYEPLHEILTLLRRSLGCTTDAALPDLLESTVFRFEKAVLTNPPCQMSTIDQIPFKEGFDALYQHFRQSTFDFVNEEHSGPQTIQQYLNLLKAHWLLNILKASDSVKKKGTHSLAQRLLSQVELRILQQYSRHEIRRYEEHELVELPDAAFRIWPDPHVVLERSVTESFSNILETRLLEIQLANFEPDCTEQLHVMKVSDKILRLVRHRQHNNPTRPKESISWVFNLHEDLLLPWYSINPSGGVEISTAAGACREEFHLQNRVDAFKLQSAFTGYGVLTLGGEFTNVGLAVTYARRGRRDQYVGEGQVQLWQWPIEDTTSPRRDQSEGPSSPSIPEMRSLSSESSSSLASLVTERMDSSVVENAGGVLWAKLPPPPLLVGFTKHENTYTMWQVDRKQHVSIKEDMR
jgi:hypothetical protein